MKTNQDHRPGPRGNSEDLGKRQNDESGATLNSSHDDQAVEIGVSRTKTGGEHIEVIRPLWSIDNALTLEAWDHSLRRAVIVRKLAPGASTNELMCVDFWRQARNQARLRHNRILSVLFIDRLSGWVVTEFCDRRLLDEAGPTGMPSDLLCRVLIQALEGLEFLHGTNQIHGGINPGVMLLTSDGSVKLDLPSGLEVGSELTLRRGLEKYASPESLDENKFGSVGPKSDIYALGMTALELLAGKKFEEFFRGYGLDFTDGSDSWLRWKLSADAIIPNATTILPKVDPILASVIQRMLEKHVNDRPSASEVISALTGNVQKPARSLQLTENAPQSLPIGHSSLLSIEPAVIAAHPRTADVYTHIPGTSKKGLQSWAENLVNDTNPNYLAAAMILLAAFVAGFSFVGSSPQKTELTALSVSEDGSGSVEMAVAKPDATNDGVAAEPDLHPAVIARRSPPPVIPPKVTQQPKEKANLDKPKAAPPDGRIFVSAKPEGAWVRINGKLSQSGCEISLPPGRQTIQVGKWDCLPQEQAVDVPPGQAVHVSVGLKLRPTTGSYEPVLCGPDDTHGKADELVTRCLNQLGSGSTRTDSLITLERELKNEQPLNSDPRVLHAVAVASLGQKYNARRAISWYERASRKAPVYYSWPYKGLIKCAIAQGNFDEAIRYNDDFVYRAQDLVAHYQQNAKAKLFLADTACFAGRVIGFVEAASKNIDGRSLTSRDLEFKLPSDEAAVFRNAKLETIARYKETVGDEDCDPNESVWQFLGDSVAKERVTLLESIGNHNCTKVRVKLLADYRSPATDTSSSRHHQESIFKNQPDTLITQAEHGN